MLTTIRDEHGDILAALEWHLVNAEGLPNINGLQGAEDSFRYVFITHLERSPGISNGRLLSHLRLQLLQEAPMAVGAYWSSRCLLRTKPFTLTRARALQEVRRSQYVRQ